MKARIGSYRYGSPREASEGLRLGVTRHVPRGVRREDWQRRNYFDVWLPLLAPTAELLARYRAQKIDFKTFARHYRQQMKASPARQGVELLAAVSHFQPITVGCFCENESTCHRSLLVKVLRQEASRQAPAFSRWPLPNRKTSVVAGAVPSAGGRSSGRNAFRAQRA
jgi:uncharacterized protein YeaO (DUF488 family)